MENPMFLVDNDEVAAITAIPIPEHPNTTFDQVEFSTLVANSFSITKEEKTAIIEKCGTFTQHQIDEVIRILKEEKTKFNELNEKYQKGLEALEKEVKA